jgi:DNA-binding beta-propeller fold protein YncE
MAFDALSGPLSRRSFAGCCLAGLGGLLALSGCEENEDGSPTIGKLDLIWGRRGISDGRLQKPRAMAIDRQDRLYIVDMTARIQVFDTDGKFLHGWQTPDHTAGKPTGMSIDHQGRVLVSDTHYYQLLVYSPQGKLLDRMGGTLGNRPGEFGLVTDAVQDSQGNLYIAEYGEYDRIQKFSPEGRFLLQFGGHGSEPGQFLRPQNMAIDTADRIWVADACNHRIQIFDVNGKLLDMWGVNGAAPGQLCYPYDLIFDREGHLYICEFGNHRIQKFTTDGKSLGTWGKEGRREGELFNPWAIELDSQGRLHVLDTNNHRMQRVVV